MERRSALEKAVLLIPVVIACVMLGRYANERSGQRAMLEAVGRDDAPEVIRLLEKGIDPRRAKPRGAAPISLAASARANKTLAALLKHGERPAQDDVAAPALRGDVEMVDTLLQNGADPNAHTRGLVPLMLELASERNTPMMARLLQAGANPNVVSKVGWNKPLGCTPLMASTLAINPDGVSALLHAHCRVNERIEDPASVWNGYTALMMAVHMHDVRSVKMLMQAGARTNIRAADGETAISLAKRLLSKDILALLVNKPEPRSATHR
jgi:ankyrin repeat protein